MKNNISKLICAVLLSLSVIAGAVQSAADGTGGSGGGIGGVLSASTLLK